MDDFFRFPHTPHIAWLAEGTPRDDKLLSPDEVSELLAGDVAVEEKLDGANLGFSVSPEGLVRAQNRGQYLVHPSHGQFARLEPWLEAHEECLFDALGPNLIAFGEWCAARHSLEYPSLPDWWLLFDVYDRQTQAFWSTARRDAWARAQGFSVVRCLHRGPVTLAQLRQWVMDEGSAYRTGSLEGVVVRREDAQWLLARGKLVRPDFTQTMGAHWRSRTLEWNRLALGGDPPT
jgi:ATP-dependent RNA circularization protein (DNA/RNA ligase family)